MKKRLILMVMFMFGLTWSTAAQKGYGGSNRLDSMTAHLNPNETQKLEVIGAVKAKRTQLKALKTEVGLDKKSQVARKKVILGEFDNKMKTILTAEQYKQYQTEVAQKKAEVKSQNASKWAAEHADSMKIRYGLNEAQHGAVKTALTTKAAKYF